MPVISVVMSNYNKELEYVHQAVESILNQTFQDFEFYIIDDASTNGIQDYFLSLQDPRIKLIFHTNNQGQSASFNEAISLASGEFIAIMDSDDISMPTRLEKEVQYLKNHPDISLVSCWYERFQNSSEVRNPVIQNMAVYRTQLLFGFSPAVLHGAAMMRKTFFTEHHLWYNPSYTGSNDYELWVRAAKVVNFAILPEILFRYRIHHNQITQESAGIQNSNSLLRITQFKELGLEISVKEADELSYLLDQPYSDRQAEWICKIIAANEKSGYVNKKALRKFLKHELQNCAVIKARKEGLASVSSYRTYMGFGADLIMKCRVMSKKILHSTGLPQ